MKTKYLLNQKGVSLVEIISVLVILTITTIFALSAIILFFNKYRELSYFSELQKSSLEAIETLKYGFPFTEGGGVYAFQGIVNANYAELMTPSMDGNFVAIHLRHIHSRSGDHDYVRFFWDRISQTIRMEAYRSASVPQFYQRRIFPEDPNSRIRVTNFDLSSLDGQTVNPGIIKMEMEAEIDIDEETVRRVHFTTNIAIGRRF